MARTRRESGRPASTREGVEHVSDTEDWVGCIAEFANGVTGVFESVKTATGYAGGPTSRDWCEVNASDSTVV